ncbi:MAG: hypothetical protein Q8877_03345 [Sweet potato little leaf phytoplasma]|nr:hypothetical protein [Sweet potato little leaf phytoplasma]
MREVEERRRKGPNEGELKWLIVFELAGRAWAPKPRAWAHFFAGIFTSLRAWARQVGPETPIFAF